jgi:Flp pilus assembly protein CpaB
LARSVGTLSLVLRSHSDNIPVQTAGARKLDLLPQVAAAVVVTTAAKTVPPRSRAAKPAPPSTPTAEPAAPPTPEPARFEVIRGLSVSQE